MFVFLIYFNACVNKQLKHRFKAGFLRLSRKDNKLSKSGNQKENRDLHFEEINLFDSTIKTSHLIQKAVFLFLSSI